MESLQKTNLIVVCGPTASGKTRLGVQLAQCVDGEIVSFDSRQIYRGMDIGTGKDFEEYETPHGAIRYHLIDIVGPNQIYTLWDYQRDFYRVFREVHGRRKMPVAVGGTGLYIEAVLKHYCIPNVPENEQLRSELMTLGKDELECRLNELDPELHARTDRRSKKRIVRALEVALYGKGHSIQWGHKDPPRITPLVIGVRWERAVLRERVRKRLLKRLEQGLVEEVRTLLDSEMRAERFAFFGMEYKHVARFLRSEVPYESMVSDLLHNICQLAKRQETYFRGMERRGIPIRWVDKADVEEAKSIISEIRRTC